MDPVINDPNQKKIMRIYAAFGAGLVLSLAPNMIAALVSAVLILGVLTMAYVLRTDTEEGSLLENHMTFIIRTIWIGSFLALITMSAAGLYLFKLLDNTPLNPCVEKLLSMGLDPAADPMAMMNAFQGCWDGYWAANMKILIVSGIMAAGPVLVYFLARFAKGYSRARGGYRLANPKAWF